MPLTPLEVHPHLSFAKSYLKYVLRNGIAAEKKVSRWHYFFCVEMVLK